MSVDWPDQAACKTHNTSLFYPEPGRDADAAKQICAACPVREDCLTHAITRREPHGVWGGLTETERAALLRKTGDHPQYRLQPGHCKHCGRPVPQPRTPKGPPRETCSGACRNALYSLRRQQQPA